MALPKSVICPPNPIRKLVLTQCQLTLTPQLMNNRPQEIPARYKYICTPYKIRNRRIQYHACVVKGSSSGQPLINSPSNVGKTKQMSREHRKSKLSQEVQDHPQTTDFSIVSCRSVKINENPTHMLISGYMYMYMLIYAWFPRDSKMVKSNQRFPMALIF